MMRPDGDQRRARRRALFARTRGRRIALAVLGVALVAAAFTIPIPLFYTYLPGPIRDVQRLVEVSDARTYPSEGTLYMTTVSLDVNVTLAELVVAAVDRHRTVVLKDDVTGGLSLERLEQNQRREMTSSKQRAREVALSALGYGKPTGDGARVVDTVQGAPAQGALRTGDVIVAVNGRSVDLTCDVSHAVDEAGVGEDIELTLRRNGDLERVTLTTAANPFESGAFIGVFMRDVGYSFDPDVTVDFSTGKVAGPSAGLMFTLALYDRLTPGDLTGGRAIAGTGSIDCGGEVGSIGGVVQKVAAAEARGAEVFLAPTGNADAARRTAGDIEVVSVGSFSDAVDYLGGAET